MISITKAIYWISAFQIVYNAQKVLQKVRQSLQVLKTTLKLVYLRKMNRIRH